MDNFHIDVYHLSLTGDCCPMLQANTPYPTSSHESFDKQWPDQDSITVRWRPCNTHAYEIIRVSCIESPMSSQHQAHQCLDHLLKHMLTAGWGPGVYQ